VTESTWRELVEQAALMQDRAALAALYAEAQTLFGDQAPRRWAEALSAFDALAVTG